MTGKNNSINNHGGGEYSNEPLGDAQGSSDVEMTVDEEVGLPIDKDMIDRPPGWKRLGRNVNQHRGSILHRNNERTDHLQRLFLKRQISEQVISNMNNDIKSQSTDNLQREVSMEDIPSVSSIVEESYMDELRAEVDSELNVKDISTKLKEINDMTKQYSKYLKGVGKFPLEVKLKQVSYTVPIDVNDMKKIKTVYNSSVLYPICEFIRRTYKGKKKPAKQVVQFPVLDEINLVLRPGVQYLVLGPPGSGKSSLLKMIAGLIRPPKGAIVKGSIEYNGRTLEEKNEFHIENAFAYIDQLDKHAPRLTVEETFEFAYQCLTGGKYIREKLTGEAAIVAERADKEHLATRMTLASLGLQDVAHTYVGDNLIRGVSGGQRRRVTVGEMLGSRAPVMCGDEISTGLDASSTYDMVQVILHYGRQRKQTNIFALLQPSPETVSLFDEVIVLAEGKIIYAGPIDQVEDYFADIGFKSPPFTDVADFLQLVSTDDSVDLYDPSDSIRSLRPDPPTVSDLATIFKESEYGKHILKELERPSMYVWKEGDRRSEHGVSKVSDLSTSEAVRTQYANNFLRATSLIVNRFLLLWIRDRRVIIASFVKNVLMGVSVGGVFFNTLDPISIQGCLFQAGLFIMLGSMQSSSGLIIDRVIFYKHTDANFYSAWPFVVGRVVSQLPQTTFDTVVFGTILYYMVGLAGRVDTANFFIYLSTLLVFALLMNQQMAVFASFVSGGGGMQVYGACTLLAMMLFGGFIIAPVAIPGYYSWIYWWNPFAWAFRSLVVNEFRSQRWEDSNEVLSATGIVRPNGEPFSEEWVGYAFFYMIPYFLICCVATALGLTHVRNSGQKASPGHGRTKEPVTLTMDTVVIPFIPVTLSFSNICYEVTASTSAEKLTLLKSVSGIFRPGEMCALMGSSGAGKTTLMDVIALRKRSGTISGEILLNGWPQEASSFRRCSGYVEQFDVQSPELTVKETIMFSARLRLDPDIIQSDEERQSFVQSVMADAELIELADSLVGIDEDGGLSFEQKKRLSIAVELAASPSIIFLDEPTSGLDARSALLVVKTLNKIADGGRTICATIHQPSSAVFEMFDQLLLLKRGGQVVYHGQLGNASEKLVQYFESRGAPVISLGENPANWMLRVLTESSNDLADVYLHSDDFKNLQEEIKTIKEDPVAEKKIEFDSEFATSPGRRRDLLNRRLGLIYWRSPAYNYARIMVSIVISVLLSSVFIFKQEELLNEVDMRAHLSVIFLSFIIVGIMAVLSVIPVMEKIRDSFYRHRDAGMYDSGSLGLALGVAEKYFIVFSSAIFCLVFLGTSGVGNRYRGLISFWGFFTFNFAIYSYMGQLFVCLVRSTATSIILSSVFIGLNNFFAGLIVRPQYLVGFYAVPYYISPSHYVYESLVMSVYYKNQRPVLATVGSDFYEYLVQQKDCVAGSTTCEGTAYQYVYVFFDGNFTADHTLRNAIILGFVLVLSRVLTWLALKKIRF